MKDRKKQMIISILLMISLLLITVGASFAVFNYVKEGTTENTVTTGSITFIYEEKDANGKGIKIENAFPISDEQGKVLSDSGNIFNFTVKSNTPKNQSIPYTVTARKDSLSTLDDSAVKIYLTEVEGIEEKELLLNTYDNLANYVNSKEGITEKVLYTDIVPKDTDNYQKDFRLRMWIDDSVDFSDGSMNGKTFSITVNVYADAEVVENSGMYYDIDSVVASFDETSLKETVMCSYIDRNSRLYYDCKIHETIEDALASKDNGVIILTSDINLDNGITINNDQDIILELNGKTIAYQAPSDIATITNNGILTIDDLVGTGTISTNYRVIRNFNKLTINNGNYIRENISSNAGGVIGNNSVATINNGVFKTDTTWNVWNSVSSAVLTINDGYFTSESNSTVVVYNGGIININDGYFHANNANTITVMENTPGTVNIKDGSIISNSAVAVLNKGTATINIDGGSYYSYGEISTIFNMSTGTVNINQIDRPLYIANLTENPDSIYKPVAINNYLSGIVNIKGQVADNCNSTINSNTSGLCIYSNYRTVLNESGAIGIINVDGAYIVSDKHLAVHNYNGTIKVSNSHIVSNNNNAVRYTNLDDKDSYGNIYLCNNIIQGSNYDISSDATHGYIYYNSNNILVNNTIYDPNSKVILDDTMTCK